jgi:hypothetical protein
MKCKIQNGIITIKLSEMEFENLGESCDFNDKFAKTLIRRSINDICDGQNPLLDMLYLLKNQDDSENLGELKARIDKLLTRSYAYVDFAKVVNPKSASKLIAKYSYELVNALLDVREKA